MSESATSEAASRVGARFWIVLAILAVPVGVWVYTGRESDRIPGTPYKVLIAEGVSTTWRNPNWIRAQAKVVMPKEVLDRILRSSSGSKYGQYGYSIVLFEARCDEGTVVPQYRSDYTTSGEDIETYPFNLSKVPDQWPPMAIPHQDRDLDALWIYYCRKLLPQAR